MGKYRNIFGVERAAEAPRGDGVVSAVVVDPAWLAEQLSHFPPGYGVAIAMDIRATERRLRERSAREQAAAEHKGGAAV